MTVSKEHTASNNKKEAVFLRFIKETDDEQVFEILTLLYNYLKEEKSIIFDPLGLF